MDAIRVIRDKARACNKTIVLPEFNDKRTIEAARIIENDGIAKVVVLSPDRISPEEKESCIQDYLKIHEAKHPDIEEVRKIFEDTLYPAAMMTRRGKFDGLVGGAVHTTPDMARCAIRCLGIEERFTIASSCFIMTVPNCEYGQQGTFIFADCGIIPEPTARQLACIALASAELAARVLGITARVALLSYSTKGSAKGSDVEKVTEALGMLKEMAPDLLADGEMQLDAAIVPEVANIKYPDSPIGGKANVLIFPDLNSGNIGYKLTQRLANARAVGPLFLGLNKPASDLSRGCSVDDIVDCAAVSAIRAK